MITRMLLLALSYCFVSVVFIFAFLYFLDLLNIRRIRKESNKAIKLALQRQQDRLRYDKKTRH